MPSALKEVSNHHRQCYKHTQGFQNCARWCCYTNSDSIFPGYFNIEKLKDSCIIRNFLSDIGQDQPRLLLVVNGILQNSRKQSRHEKRQDVYKFGLNQLRLFSITKLYDTQYFYSSFASPSAAFGVWSAGNPFSPRLLRRFCRSCTKRLPSKRKLASFKCKINSWSLVIDWDHWQPNGLGL